MVFQLFLYDVGIFLLKIIFTIASLFKNKAKLFINGRKNFDWNLLNVKINNEKVYWFHCSSLGEFELSRPLIEKIKNESFNSKIVLSFFSPSGFEIQKKYSLVDLVVYLPWDTKNNALKWISILKPDFVFFAKYDFWYHYLNETSKTKAKLICFSASFRSSQLFFKPYGVLHKEMLKKFTYIAVRDLNSVLLLNNIGINAEFVGDTRFDRVFEISKSSQSNSKVEYFKNNKKLLIGGSVWLEDVKIFAEAWDGLKNSWVYVLAPHDISENMISQIETILPMKTIRYSKLDEFVSLDDFKCLIIDNIGMLSSLYKYANVAWIGGAFKQGLHNILEPATFGIPVCFGPNIRKFPEANELIQFGGGFKFKNFQDFSKLLNDFSDEQILLTACLSSKKYVSTNLGATTRILNSQCLIG